MKGGVWQPGDRTPFTCHGGDLHAARQLYPAAPNPWLDLSTGINPVAYPLPAMPAEAWTCLPAPASLRRLEEVAARRYGTPAACDTVATPGTQAAIHALPVLFGGADVRIVAPTYGSYEQVFRAAGARLRLVRDAEELAGADLAVVVNPNNPDGRLVPPAALHALAGRVGTLVVDEAFADALGPGASMVPRLPASRVLVLRSFGKFYGLAGLRLGFAIGGAALADRLRQHQGTWAVGGPALVVGTSALADDGWLRATQARLQEDGARLGQLLARIGAQPVGATALFRLVSHPAAPAVFDHLARRGILTRPFAARRDWLRFGLPGQAVDWARLVAALREFG